MEVRSIVNREVWNGDYYKCLKYIGGLLEKFKGMSFIKKGEFRNLKLKRCLLEIFF